MIIFLKISAIKMLLSVIGRHPLRLKKHQSDENALDGF